MPFMLMSHERDPKEVVRETVGDLSNIRVLKNQVLVGVYVRGEKTASGFYLPDDTRQEDEYQGKSGLVLKMGHKAFVDDDKYTFTDEDKVQIGDWVVFKASDGWPIIVNTKKGLCRLLNDVDIRLAVDAPDRVF